MKSLDALHKTFRKGKKRLTSMARRATRTETGLRADRCVMCGSADIRLFPAFYVEPAFATPPVAESMADQLHWRDNGRCLHCGLEQSFYRFSDEGRVLFYKLGLDILSDEDAFCVYPPAPAWRQKIYDEHCAKRLPKWDAYFAAHSRTSFRRALHLRSLYGDALLHLKNRYGADGYGMDVVHSCERYIREEIPALHILPGRLAGLIEPAPGAGTFDIIICMHTLVHSVDLRRDLTTLRDLLTDDGVLIFCDEITKKFHNTFHMIHFSEDQFLATTAEFFGQVDRIDDTGPHEPHSQPYTRKHDNPDFVASKPKRSS